MRYAIVSDLHANIQAWNAVLSDISTYNIDSIICLGDIVGYGPDPVRVLESAYKHVHAFVMGNHDAVACGRMSDASFNSRASRVIQWTREQLSPKACEFLSSLPLTLDGNGFKCAHGSFHNPAAFHYVLTNQEAALNWGAVPDPLIFVGHTHTPNIYVTGASRTPHLIDAQDFALEPGKRYIVNVGSVGSPRDANDVRSCYVIYDDSAQEVRFRKIPFDMDGFRASAKACGFSEEDIPILRLDPREDLQSVRQELDFAPTQSRKEEAQNVTETVDLTKTLQKRASSWRRIAILSVAAIGIGVVVAAAAQLRSSRDSAALAIPAKKLEARPVADPSHDGVLPNLPSVVSLAGEIYPWRIIFSSKGKQGVEIAGRSLLLRSDVKKEITLEAPPLTMGDEPSRKLRITFDYALSDDFSGEASILVARKFRRSAKKDAVAQWDTNRLPVKLAPGKQFVATGDLPKTTEEFQISLEGNFVGELEIKSLKAALIAPAPRQAAEKAALAKGAPGKKGPSKRAKAD